MNDDIHVVVKVTIYQHDGPHVAKIATLAGPQYTALTCLRQYVSSLAPELALEAKWAFEAEQAATPEPEVQP